MTFGTTDSTSAYYIISIPNLGTYGQWIRRKVLVDGWGGITTPVATYPNTIRVKTTLYQRDTLYVDQIFLGSNFDRPVENIYEWFNVSNGLPVFKVIERGGVITDILYLSSLTYLGVNEIGKDDLSIYPNPTDGIVNIKDSEQHSIYVFDINGKLLKSIENTTVNQLDLSILPSGVYTLKVKSLKGTKFVKIIKD